MDWFAASRKGWPGWTDTGREPKKSVWLQRRPLTLNSRAHLEDAPPTVRRRGVSGPRAAAGSRGPRRRSGENGTARHISGADAQYADGCNRMEWFSIGAPISIGTIEPPVCGSGVRGEQLWTWRRGSFWKNSPTGHRDDWLDVSVTYYKSLEKRWTVGGRWGCAPVHTRTHRKDSVWQRNKSNLIPGDFEVGVATLLHQKNELLFCCSQCRELNSSCETKWIWSHSLTHRVSLSRTLRSGPDRVYSAGVKPIFPAVVVVSICMWQSTG